MPIAAPSSEKLVRCRFVRQLVWPVLVAVPALAQAWDTDLDGIQDQTDNCLVAANPDQRDTDADGYGNFCDGDLDNDGRVNFADLSLMRQHFFSAEPHDDPAASHADLDGNGVVQFDDLLMLRSMFLGVPGPAAFELALDQGAAARFLTQATFGPTTPDIDALVALGDLDAWIDAQIAAPRTDQLDATRALAIAMCEDPTFDNGFFVLARQFAWWDTVIDGPDQLRQRVAFALSQMLVVSEVGVLETFQLGLASYLDLLATNAFGNYRDLLQQVTLHPTMGAYLSMLRNERAQPALNIRPDENYARELMQLFTLGPHLLNPDGTPVTDASGEPVPAYTQSDIESFAAVFTGWNLANISWNEWVGFGDYTLPMVPVEFYHDTGEKTLLGGVVLPAARTAFEDLEDALDNLFAQPNVGPFVARQLIQRLVTSNPSPQYVERVAARFDDNGSGTRGDLSAVVRAVLLDAEARLGHLRAPETFGKLREPLLRISHLRRAFDAQPVARTGPYFGGPDCGQGTYYTWDQPFGWLRNVAGQDILAAPSVFNFFRPDHSPAAVLRPAGLVGPEFQITNANTLTGTANLINFEIYYPLDYDPYTVIDISTEAALASDADALLDHLDLVLTSGQMSTDMRQIVHAHLTAPGIFPAGAEGDEARARDAIALIVTSPEYLIQK